MASKTIIPTRMELTKLKKTLITAVRGHKLLKDKRDELMRQFLELAKENMELRLKVEKGISHANKNFVIARAAMNIPEMKLALMMPKQEVSLDITLENIMSVNIPKYEVKTRTKMLMIYTHTDMHLHQVTWTMPSGPSRIFWMT